MLPQEKYQISGFVSVYACFIKIKKQGSLSLLEPERED